MEGQTLRRRVSAAETTAPSDLLYCPKGRSSPKNRPMGHSSPNSHTLPLHTKSAAPRGAARTRAPALSRRATPHTSTAHFASAHFASAHTPPLLRRMSAGGVLKLVTCLGGLGGSSPRGADTRRRYEGPIRGPSSFVAWDFLRHDRDPHRRSSEASLAFRLEHQPSVLSQCLPALVHFRSSSRVPRESAPVGDAAARRHFAAARRAQLPGSCRGGSSTLRGGSR